MLIVVCSIKCDVYEFNMALRTYGEYIINIYLTKSQLSRVGIVFVV